MRKCATRLIGVAAVLGAGAALVAAQGIREERVRFAPKSSSATLRGSIKGDATVDYILAARRGQSMTVTLKPSSREAFFNVLPPGSEAAIAIGTNVGNSWTGTLPVDGDYRVRVYLSRNAARANQAATYVLTVGIVGSGGSGPPGDVKVPGTKFHATGTVRCSVGTDAKESANCSFGVVRHGGGAADVSLAAPGYDVAVHKDQIRVLKFVGNKVTSADSKEKVTFEKRGDTWLVAVNGFYYYSIPDAVIVGG